MMNIENGLLSRSSGEVVKSRMDAFPGMIAATGNFNDAAMMQRNGQSLSGDNTPVIGPGILADMAVCVGALTAAAF